MGNGPAEMIAAGVSQYRMAIIMSTQKSNYKKAVMYIRAMASLLPKEAQKKYMQAIPPPPARRANQDEKSYGEDMETWIDEWLVKIEHAITSYTFDFYKRGAGGGL